MTAIMWASISSEAHLPGVRRDKENVVQAALPTGRQPVGQS